jgi:hypothetical protein
METHLTVNMTIFNRLGIETAGVSSGEVSGGINQRENQRTCRIVIDPSQMSFSRALKQMYPLIVRVEPDPVVNKST